MKGGGAVTWRLKSIGLAVALLSVAFAAQPVMAGGVVTEVLYFHLDGLGSVRAMTDADGQLVPDETRNYLAFGEEWCGTAPCTGVTAGQAKRYTAKERDAETGLDYFGARYYRAVLARFTTKDPRLSVPRNLVSPQKWNRYAYARNNPFAYVDPDGLEDYRIVVGDPGIRGERSGLDHNVGRNFERVAQTKADELRAAGHTVTVSRISSRTELERALTQGEDINKGFIYVGHGGVGRLAIGELPDRVSGPPTNLTSDDIVGLPRQTKLARNATIEFYSCYSATPEGPGRPSLAEGMAIWLHRDAAGFTGAAQFEGNGPLDSRGRPPETGPLRMVPQGGRWDTVPYLGGN